MKVRDPEEELALPGNARTDRPYWDEIHPFHLTGFTRVYCDCGRHFRIHHLWLMKLNREAMSAPSPGAKVQTVGIKVLPRPNLISPRDLSYNIDITQTMCPQEEKVSETGITLGKLKMAIALADTLENLPDETPVKIEFTAEADDGYIQIEDTVDALHIRSAPDGSAFIISTEEYVEVANAKT